MKTSTGQRKIIVKTFFSFLIVLDVLSVLHFTTDFDFTTDQVKKIATSQGISLDSKLNDSFTKSSDNFQMSFLADPFWSHIVSAISELFGLIVLLFCNILGISGIQQHKPYQLVPWLVVYIIGIISSYIGSFLLFSTQDSEGSFKLDGFLPLGLGVFFHLSWIFVKNTFNHMKTDRFVERFKCILIKFVYYSQVNEV